MDKGVAMLEIDSFTLEIEGGEEYELIVKEVTKNIGKIKEWRKQC